MTTFRILDALSRNPARAHSISELVRRINGLGYKGYYKNVYDRVQELAGKRLLDIRKTGKTSLVTLNLENLRTLDELTVMEIEKKRKFLEKEPGEEDFTQDIETIRAGNLISTAIIKTEKNARLNTAEILYITGTEEAEPLLTQTKKTAGNHNKAISPLVLTNTEFQEMLSARERNQAKEAMKDKTVLVNPQDFWKAVSRSPIREIKEKELDPGKLKTEELYYNLGRFGYAEYTAKPATKTDKINIETTAVACLLRGDARLTEAISVLLAKNSVNYRLLLYLAARHRQTNKMGYLIETTKTLIRDEEKKKTLERALKLFGMYRETPTKVDSKDPTARRWGIKTRTTQKDIQEKMRLYNAI